MGPAKEPSFLPLSSFLSLPSLFLFCALLSIVHAIDPSGWTVVPSNNSRDLSWTDQVRFHLESAQLPSGITVAPLTGALVSLDRSELTAFHAKGDLVDVDAANSLSLNSSEIAFVSCDKSAYPGNLDASQTVANLITAQRKPSAVLLYSSEVHHCNYTANAAVAGQYINVFTLLKPDSAKKIKDQLDSPRENGTTGIVADMSFTMSGTPPTHDSGGSSSDSPNTAMIILYSITGIITALFLAIIITGAVRAHRHPERYGPRYTAGRPRQSRARGIARAMLETIPIVKFGDGHDPKNDPVKGDVEMSMGAEDGVVHQTENREMTAAGETTPETAPTQPKPTQPASEATAEKQTSTDNETPTDHPNYMCPICTDDFVPGQDLRVLPCNHQFHLECIDPWLVNVSGTCPLCRIDLNPGQAEGENEQGEGEGTQAGASHEGGANEPSTDTTQQRQRHRLSSYLHGPLNARRMRDATVEERLAALRSVREEANQNRENEDTDDQQRRRSGMTKRLREKFRIRTRSHGEDGPPPS